MRQIGTKITSFWQGISYITGFGLLSAMTAYLAYDSNDEDYFAATTSVFSAVITGLAVNNTTAYMLGENSVSEEIT